MIPSGSPVDLHASSLIGGKAPWHAGNFDPTSKQNALVVTPVGANLIAVAAPGAISFLRVNADNTVSALSATDFRTAIGASSGSSSGTVTAVTTAAANNGVTATWATNTTTPALTIGLGAITPTSVSTGALSATAGTFSSGITVATVGSNAPSVIDAPSGYSAILYQKIAGVSRSCLGTDGTNTSFGSWDASGNWIDNPINIPNATNGIMTVSRPLEVKGLTYLASTNNSGGVYPTTGKGLAIGANFTSGSAEIDFWNTVTTANKGFNFYQQLTASTATNLLSLTPTLATFSGSIGATSGTFSGAVSASSFSGAGTGLTGTAASLTAGNASQLGGKSPVTSQSYWGAIPNTGTDGVMEIGKYIDFHETSADASDYSVRLTGTSGAIACSGAFSAPSFSGAGTGLTGTASSLTAGSVPWSGITSKPTTLAGYGITDSVIVTGANANINAQYTLINNITWQGSWNGVPSASNPTYVWGNNGLSGTQQLFNTANLSVNYATYANSANLVQGVYTNNGGLQPPSYIPSGKVCFNMMQGVPGAASGVYQDWLMMDTYSGGDVPYVTMLGINKAPGAARGFLAVGAKGGSTWSATEIITAANIGSQSVNYATSAGSAPKVTGPAFTNGTDGWWRSSGATGWYNDSYGVGIYATQAGFVDAYNGATFRAVDFSATSDGRLKTNRRIITNPLDKLKQLEGITYTWNELAECPDKTTRQSGVIAQDVQAVFPEAVNSTGEYLSVSYGKLVPLLIEAIKEQQKQIDELRSMI